ncbi:MAG: DUF4446 family protein [Candidatus Aquicultorales bacterium]
MFDVSQLTIASLALNGLLFLWITILSVRVRRLGVKHRTVKSLSKRSDLAEAIDELYRMSKDNGRKAHQLSEGHQAVAAALEGAVQGIGVVRFDAFDDAAGRLSFAVALLDATGSGVVISTINGRHESRSYAKPVDRGGSPYDLSDEEREAINQAMR